MPKNVVFKSKFMILGNLAGARRLVKWLLSFSTHFCNFLCKAVPHISHLDPHHVVHSASDSLSTVFQVTPGSKASSADLCVGDVILAIEGVPARELLHCEAQNRIKECSSRLCLTIDRSGA